MKRERHVRRESERERFGEHLLYSTLCINKPFVCFLIRCPHGAVLLDMVGLGHVAAGLDVDVAAGVESQKYAPGSNGFCQKCGTGKLLESYG